MPPVVVLDACVLYPAAQRDLFMWLAAGGEIRAHWTNEIHDEWMRNVERDYDVDPSVLDRVRKLMDRAAGDALIGGYLSRPSAVAVVIDRYGSLWRYPHSDPYAHNETMRIY